MQAWQKRCMLAALRQRCTCWEQQLREQHCTCLEPWWAVSSCRPGCPHVGKPSRTEAWGHHAGAVGALYGPLHGGANEAVLRMLERIGSVDKIGPFLEGVKNRKEKMFGFGHRCRATTLHRHGCASAPLLASFGAGCMYDLMGDVLRGQLLWAS